MTVHLISAWCNLEHKHARLFTVGHYCYELQDEAGNEILQWSIYSYEDVVEDLKEQGYTQKW